jgi:hypothetical protein
MRAYLSFSAVFDFLCPWQYTDRVHKRWKYNQESSFFQVKLQWASSSSASSGSQLASGKKLKYSLGKLGADPLLSSRVLKKRLQAVNFELSHDSAAIQS